MEQMQEQMNAILGNPEMMQRIMSMAQSLGQSQEAPAQEEAPPVMPDFDPKLLMKLSGLAKSGSIDSDQRSLLSALRPYLTAERIAKLEKAMRAAKLATVASGFLGQAGLPFDPGR
ncbi:MAG: hypothetical protein IKU07_08110 [Oscillospiraceae bacterium]|nr:hypothetical protein [Oscillospiraceae bacterium]